MGEDNLDDKILNEEYLKTLYVYQFSIDVLNRLEKYELACTIEESMRFWEQQYIEFRLKQYDSEGRKVVKEAYKVLGYNPYRNGDGKK